MAHKPVLHRRDHERGGTDPVRFLWTDEPADGGGGAGVNDAVLDATWTYLGGIFALDTVIPGTITNGTTPGDWNANGDGTAMICGLGGTWTIDIAGTVTHASTTAPTIVRYVTPDATETDIFSENMANGDSHALSYSVTHFFAVDDTIALNVTHQIASGTPSSTLTGTMTFTL